MSKRGAALLVGMMVCLCHLAFGISQVVDDGKPNVHPELVALFVEAKVGVVPVYNITGQQAYDLFKAAGRDMLYVSLRKGAVFPVYKKQDVDRIYGVKYPGDTYPVMLAILGGTFTQNGVGGKCYQIVDNNGSMEVYSWMP